jgi:hypothetical protein
VSTVPPLLDVPPAFARDFEVLFYDKQSIQLEMSKYQAWCFLSAVQLASRHPLGRESTPMQTAMKMARAIQEAIATTPALANVAERGWSEDAGR